MVKKIKNIEFLRIIFLLSIVCMHLCSRAAKIVNFDYIQSLASGLHNGGKAVDGFFILSGIFLVLTFKNSTSIADFVKKKIFRLTPVILFATIIAAIGSIFHLIKFSLPSAVLELSFTQMLLTSTKITNWNELGILWYVSVMFWILLFYFYAIKYFDKKYVNFTIGVITVFSYYLALHIHGGSLGSPTKDYGIFSLGFLRGFGGIGIGYFIGEWYKNYRKEKTKFLNKLFYSLLEIVFLVAVIAELMFLNTPHKYNFTIVIYITILIILFMMKKGYISEFLNKDCCTDLAKYSYSIYVLHMLIFALLDKAGVLIYFGQYYLIPAILIPLITGIIAYHLIEKPIGKYLCQKYL